MNTKVWVVCMAILSAGFIGCSKKQALSPEDTALLKGGNRGTFVNGGADGEQGEELLSPVGATITGLSGDGSPRRIHSGAIIWPMASVLLSRSFLALINTTSVQMNVPNSRRLRLI